MQRCDRTPIPISPWPPLRRPPSKRASASAKTLLRPRERLHWVAGSSPAMVKVGLFRGQHRFHFQVFAQAEFAAFAAVAGALVAAERRRGIFGGAVDVHVPGA